MIQPNIRLKNPQQDRERDASQCHRADATYPRHQIQSTAGENQAAQIVATSGGVLKIEMHKPPGRDRSSPCLLAVKK